MTDPLSTVFAWELSQERARIADLHYQSDLLYRWYQEGEIDSREAVKLDARINRELEQLANNQLMIPFN